MMKTNSDKSKIGELKKMIEETLKTGGFLFPETVEEVKEFERIFGTTDLFIPSELAELTFLFKNSKADCKIQTVIPPAENIAMAAREGSNVLPDQIKQRIIEDIINDENKRKKCK